MTLSQLSPHRLPLLLALCVTLITLGGSEFSAFFRYEREAILHGQVWRIFSGHLAHLGWSHLSMNVAGLALIWALTVGVYSNTQWLLILAGLMLGTSFGLLVLNPELVWYVGLSGVLHGMLTAGVIADIRNGSRSAYLLLIAVAGKLIWEQFAGPLPGSQATAGGTVIVDAHLYGGICGIILGALLTPQKTVNVS
ncbi:MAG: rhombosortase [Ectothiorhodospiraceae bacterium]|nr:rhombosortase [Ectothiorhodospiraceae bacterium]